jgi:hypothetical protein
MGVAVDGIEPCAKSEAEGTQCMCGIEFEVLAGKKTFEGAIPAAKCRLCTGTSEHHCYQIDRFGQPWGVEVCNICLLVCEEY